MTAQAFATRALAAIDALRDEASIEHPAIAAHLLAIAAAVERRALAILEPEPLSEANECP